MICNSPKLKTRLCFAYINLSVVIVILKLFTFGMKQNKVSLGERYLTCPCSSQRGDNSKNSEIAMAPDHWVILNETWHKASLRRMIQSCSLIFSYPRGKDWSTEFGSSEPQLLCIKQYCEGISVCSVERIQLSSRCRNNCYLVINTRYIYFTSY